MSGSDMASLCPNVMAPVDLHHLHKSSVKWANFSGASADILPAILSEQNFVK